MNIVEGIFEESNRVRELRKQYVAIGPPGMFGCMSIDQAIKEGEDAVSSDDVIRILKAYENLKSITG